MDPEERPPSPYSRPEAAGPLPPRRAVRDRQSGRPEAARRQSPNYRRSAARDDVLDREGGGLAEKADLRVDAGK